MPALPNTAARCAWGNAVSGVIASMASIAAATAHSTRSVRGRSRSLKRQVNRQKQAVYSTSAMELARAAINVVANGQGLVASTLAMNSTQNSAMSAYQP
ncbi:hypothetical protein G6F58_013675 [Rhizopus delemar]|nr:hypothetical protein G6F31_020471 [Rhizopus arrhizus]KAG1387299.1 hypothetical protein G6F58_013675 [Rhizopus delemar]